MTPPEIEFRDLSPEIVRANLSAILAIAADVEDEYWDQTHLLRDLPDKWSLSFSTWCDGSVVGYAIVSRPTDDCAHLHHFMIAQPYRRQGLGKRMIDEMEKRVRRAGCKGLTLKVNEGNGGAQQFYGRFGYRATRSDGPYLVFERLFEHPTA